MGDAQDADLDAVIEEIKSEAGRRRASGEIPADLEAALDADFMRTAEGLGRAASDGGSGLDREDIAPPLPTPSVRSGTVGRLRTRVKRWTFRATLWQMEDLTKQVNRQLEVRDAAIRSLTQRVDALERARGGEGKGSS